MAEIRNRIIEKIEEKNFIKEYNEICKKHKTFKVEINKNWEIKTWDDYIRVIEKEFKFPKSCEGSKEKYLEYMKDLNWLDYEAYVLVIKRYESFLFNPEMELYYEQYEVVTQFIDNILPYWEYEVLEKENGKPKLFCVYLIDTPWRESRLLHKCCVYINREKDKYSLTFDNDTAHTIRSEILELTYHKNNDCSDEEVEVFVEEYFKEGKYKKFLKGIK